ncbi:TPA: hypothetical protein ACX3DT_003495 [Vibrio parahaemolyticus]|uniref:hypothetical protein n=1 Tax=Vibrio alginolyticus TaxID=663 RepID=UPI003754072C
MMKIVSKEVKIRIIVTCHDTERESTEDWLTNQGYEPLTEWQYASNEFWCEAEKSTTINLNTSEVVASSKLDCARNFIKQNNMNEKIVDDEFHPPILQTTEIYEYPECVVFKTRRIGERVLIYVLRDGENFKAVGWAKKT